MLPTMDVRTEPSTRVAVMGDAAQSVETFEWRHLRFHVVTAQPLRPEQKAAIARMLPTIDSVTRFAQLLGMVTERHVRIRSERPSPDVRFEIGR